MGFITSVENTEILENKSKLCTSDEKQIFSTYRVSKY